MGWHDSPSAVCAPADQLYIARHAFCVELRTSDCKKVKKHIGKRTPHIGLNTPTHHWPENLSPSAKAPVPIGQSTRAHRPKHSCPKGQSTLAHRPEHNCPSARAPELYWPAHPCRYAHRVLRQDSPPQAKKLWAKCSLFLKSLHFFVILASVDVLARCARRIYE